MILPCPAPPLAELLLWDDRAMPRNGAWNMAVDEALLGWATEHRSAILRVYRWSEPTLSFGYFIPIAEARAAQGRGESLIRRWTGGGLVHHADAMTWSLVVPREVGFSEWRPAESYARLHEVLARVLASAGWSDLSVVPPASAAPAGGLCAEAAAPGDILWQGRKIAGAGQRRTRLGLLHQGVLFFPESRLPEDFPQRLAGALSVKWATMTPPLDGLAEAGRYASREWNEGARGEAVQGA